MLLHCVLKYFKLEPWANTGSVWVLLPFLSFILFCFWFLTKPRGDIGASVDDCFLA